MFNVVTFLSPSSMHKNFQKWFLFSNSWHGTGTRTKDNEEYASSSRSLDVETTDFRHLDPRPVQNISLGTVFLVYMHKNLPQTLPTVLTFLKPCSIKKPSSPSSNLPHCKPLSLSLTCNITPSERKKPCSNVPQCHKKTCRFSTIMHMHILIALFVTQLFAPHISKT